jgi:hypothetical protein
LLFIQNICFSQIPEYKVCYGADKTFSISEGDSVDRYQWLTKLSTDLDYSVFIPWGDINVCTLNNIVSSIDIRCVKDTNNDDIFDTILLEARVIPYLEFLPGIIVGNDTICYNTMPNQLTVSNNCSGGLGTYYYNWEESANGEIFTEIEGATEQNYQPNNLLSTTYYRLRFTSSDGCTVVSNVVKVNVYEKIDAGNIFGDTLCYNTGTQIEVNAIGGGDEYTYKWIDSYDNEVGTTKILNTGNLTSSEQYRVVVTSVKGCSFDTSNVANVLVYDEFKPGKISTILDSACYGTKPNYTIDSIQNCTGGKEPYTYRWLVSTDSLTFVEAPNDLSAVSYQPDTIYQTMYYRLRYTSDMGCGVTESNIHKIKMNSLPPIHTISGDQEVCYEQFETYTLPEYSNVYSYEWSTENNSGEVYTLSLNNDSVEIYWNNPNYADSIIIEVTNNITGCVSYSSKSVETNNYIAPQRTTIIRKPNSNILICEQDSSALYYEWGYTERETNEDYIIENSNRRYVLLPHNFDSTKYLYWVNLRPDKDSPCYSISYYNSQNDQQIDEPMVADQQIDKPITKVLIPTLNDEKISIVIINDRELPITCQVYSVEGILVFSKNIGNSALIDYNIDSTTLNGTYVVRVTIGKEVFTHKIIVE